MGDGPYPKIILWNPFAEAKSLCIFATGILGTVPKLPKPQKVVDNARTEENISAIEAQEEEQTWVQGTYVFRERT
jgi:hypothetical protein